MARLARNSITASFLPEERKMGLLSEIDAWIATRPS
jgi:adenosine deaminase